MHIRTTLLDWVIVTIALAAATGAGGIATADQNNLVLWYSQPAKQWIEALPIGNGRLGCMVFGGVDAERLQLNEDSVWSGSPDDNDNPEALAALPEVRRLLFAGKYKEANSLASRKVDLQRRADRASGNGGRVPFGCYQTLGDLTLDFDAHGQPSQYRRELDLDTAIAKVELPAWRCGVHARSVFERRRPGVGRAVDVRQAGPDRTDGRPQSAGTLFHRGRRFRRPGDARTTGRRPRRPNRTEIHRSPEGHCPERPDRRRAEQAADQERRRRDAPD